MNRFYARKEARFESGLLHGLRLAKLSLRLGEDAGMSSAKLEEPGMCVKP